MKTLPVHPNTITALAKHIAPKRDIRYYLNGVLIESDGKHVYYVATDSHTIVVVRDEVELGEGAPSGQWIIPRDDAMRLAKEKLGIVADLEIDDSKAPAISGEIGGVRFEFIDGNFPNWRRVVPRESPSGEPAYLNPAYLSAVFDCYADVAGNKTKGTLWHNLAVAFNGDKRIASIAEDNFYAGIMPMREIPFSGISGIQDWILNAHKQETTK